MSRIYANLLEQKNAVEWEKKSTRRGLLWNTQHGRRFIVLEHQYGRRGMWKRSKAREICIGVYIDEPKRSHSPAPV